MAIAAGLGVLLTAVLVVMLAFDRAGEETVVEVVGSVTKESAAERPLPSSYGDAPAANDDAEGALVGGDPFVSNDAGAAALADDVAEAERAAALQPDEPTSQEGRSKAAPSHRSRRAGTSSAKSRNVAPATLVFRVVPYGDVYVDGKKIGTTPLPPLEVRPGPHSVVIRYGDAKKQLDFRVRSGQSRTVRVNMSAP